MRKESGGSDRVPLFARLDDDDDDDDDDMKIIVKIKAASINNIAMKYYNNSQE